MGGEHKEATVYKDFIMTTYLIHSYRLTHIQTQSITHRPSCRVDTPFGGSTENIEFFMSVPSAANVPSTIIL